MPTNPNGQDALRAALDIAQIASNEAKQHLELGYRPAHYAGYKDAADHIAAQLLALSAQPEPSNARDGAGEEIERRYLNGLDDGARFALEELASQLGLKTYDAADCYEDWESNVAGTVRNILAASKVGNLIAAALAPAPVSEPRHYAANACDITEAEDMEAVGRSFMEAIDDNRSHPLLKGWAPMDGPAEIIVDLLNAYDEKSPAPVSEQPVGEEGLRADNEAHIIALAEALFDHRHSSKRFAEAGHATGDRYIDQASWAMSMATKAVFPPIAGDTPTRRA
jgi:hypothetical protein